MSANSDVKVSIIVPVYKVENYLTQCLESVIKQTLPEIEIIIVDEGDRDRCRQIIDYYERIDSRVITIHEKNGGYGASVNKGIMIAKGKYIGIVESDDWISSDMYEKLYQRAEQWQPDIVKGSFEYIQGHKGLRPDDARAFLQRNIPQDIPFTIRDFPYLIAAHPSIWAGIYKRDFIKKHLFLTAKGSGYVDLKFYFDVYCSATSIVYFPDIVYHWRVDNEGASCNNINLSNFIERWESNVSKLIMDHDLLENVGSCAISKIYDSILRRFAFKTTVVSQEDVTRVSQCLKNFTVLQIEKAPLVTEKQKETILLCRENPEEYYDEIMRSKQVPIVQCENAHSGNTTAINKVFRKLKDPALLSWLYIGFFISITLLAAFQKDVFDFIFTPSICTIGSYFCFFTLSFFLLMICCAYFVKFPGKLLQKKGKDRI